MYNLVSSSMSRDLNQSNTATLLDAIFQAIEDEDDKKCYSLVTVIPDINSIHPDLSIGIIHAASTIPCTPFSRDLFRNLVRWKIDVNAPTEEGYTPLDVAVSNDRLQTAKFLLKHGALPTKKTLELAQESIKASCEQLIRNALGPRNTGNDRIALTSVDTRNDRNTLAAVDTGCDRNAMAPVNTGYDRNALAPVDSGYDTDTLVQDLRKLGLNPGPINKTTKPLYLRYRDRHQPGGVPAPILSSSSNQNRKTFSPELELVLSKDNTSDLHSTLVIYDVLEEKLTDHFVSKISSKAKICFTYLLLNSQVTNNLPKRKNQMRPVELFRTFLNAIFYVGKGTNARPYAHLHEAKVALEKNLRPKSDKTRQILSLWNSSIGIICLSAFRNTSSDEALSREAAMIAALGVGNLTNEIGSAFAKDLKWSGKDKCRLGAALLYRCFRIHMSEGERPLLHTHVS